MYKARSFSLCNFLQCHVISSVFPRGATAVSWLDHLTPQFLLSHSDTPRSVGLFWASDRSVEEPST